MSELTTDDGLYYFVEQGDGNKVLYPRDPNTGVVDWTHPIWDKWSHEASHSAGIDIPPPKPPDIQAPTPDNSDRLVNQPMEVDSDVNPIGMAYWRNINNHAGSDTLRVFLSVKDQLILYEIDKRTCQKIGVRPLDINHTGEGCFFSRYNRHKLFIPTSKELYSIDITTGAAKSEWALNDGNNNLWQMHASFNEVVFSATIENENYDPIKWGVFKNGRNYFFPMNNIPDECQIDKSGEFLLVKEKIIISENEVDEYNRIIHVESGEEITIHNKSGALGHSDAGFGCFMGENDFGSLAGQLDVIEMRGNRDFAQWSLFSTGIWNMGYVSFCNATPQALEQQKALMTTPNNLISIKLDGTMSNKIVCSNLTESQQYEHRPKANLCPLGQFAAFTAFVNGSIRAYIVGIPDW